MRVQENCIKFERTKVEDEETNTFLSVGHKKHAHKTRDPKCWTKMLRCIRRKEMTGKIAEKELWDRTMTQKYETRGDDVYEKSLHGRRLSLLRFPVCFSHENSLSKTSNEARVTFRVSVLTLISLHQRSCKDAKMNMNEQWVKRIIIRLSGYIFSSLPQKELLPFRCSSFPLLLTWYKSTHFGGGCCGSCPFVTDLMRELRYWEGMSWWCKGRRDTHKTQTHSIIITIIINFGKRSEPNDHRRENGKKNCSRECLLHESKHRQETESKMCFALRHEWQKSLVRTIHEKVRVKSRRRNKQNLRITPGISGPFPFLIWTVLSDIHHWMRPRRGLFYVSSRIQNREREPDQKCSCRTITMHCFATSVRHFYSLSMCLENHSLCMAFLTTTPSRLEY